LVVEKLPRVRLPVVELRELRPDTRFVLDSKVVAFV
jgi:hypothetical protein